jgi:hypothetical protein
MPGVYGTVRPANVNPMTEVEIYYHYRPTRGTLDNIFGEDFVKLDNTCLAKASGVTDGNEIEVLKGLYSLRLPMDKFSEKGIYTIYIKPSEYSLNIVDVSILENYNNPVVEGIVINAKDVDGNIDLTGYRVEYYDGNGDLTDTVRLITSCNACEPVKVTVGDSYARSTRYRINNVNSNQLLFCTLTPSTSSSYKPNASPSPGYVGQTIHVINTKFNPVLLEIEMVDHDADTLSTMLEGDQIHDLDNGLLTTYDENKQIYKQCEFHTLKAKNGTPLYDVKVYKKPSEIDTEGQRYDNIIES